MKSGLLFDPFAVVFEVVDIVFYASCLMKSLGKMDFPSLCVLITLERTRRERTYHCRYKELKNEDEDEGFFLSVVLVRFGAFVVFLTLLLLFKRERQQKKMGKERFSAFDVCAEVSCLRRSILGLWCAQIYDGAEKNSLLLKFNKPASEETTGRKQRRQLSEARKVNLLVQPGVKLLCTRYAKPSTSSGKSDGNGSKEQQSGGPSNFVQKLRKHVKQKRLNDIRQLGMDRAVLLTFGASETETKLVVELYASGNAVLCDREFMVMTLLRSHVDKRKNLKILGKRRYPVERFRAFRMPTREAWEDALRGVYQEEERAVDLDEDEMEDEKAYEEEKKRREIERLANIRAPQTLRECLCRGFSFGAARSANTSRRKPA